MNPVWTWYFVTPCKGFRILEFGKFHLWNPEAWALDSGMQLKESEILLTDKNCNLVPGIRNPRLSWILLLRANFDYLQNNKRQRQHKYLTSKNFQARTV